MRTKIAIAARAGRDLFCAAGVVSLGAFFAVERSWLWLAPMVLLLAGAAWILYRLESWRARRRDGRQLELRQSRKRAERAVGSLVRASETVPTKVPPKVPLKVPSAARELAEKVAATGLERDEIRSVLQNQGFSRSQIREAVA